MVEVAEDPVKVRVVVIYVTSDKMQINKFYVFKGSDVYFGILCFLSVVGLFYECIVKGRPFRRNSAFVYSDSAQLRRVYDTDWFHSGIWLSYYYQYKRWHGPYELSLTFDSEFLEVTGSGRDDVGLFSIYGIYSHKTRRIGLTKTYNKGTGNKAENFGHKVIIQLKQDALHTKFVGKWFIRTCRYRGEGKFILKSKPENGHEVNYCTTETVTWV